MTATVQTIQRMPGQQFIRRGVYHTVEEIRINKFGIEVWTDKAKFRYDRIKEVVEDFLPTGMEV